MKTGMALLGLAWRYLWSRPVATLLNLALLAVSVASITLVLLVREQVDRAFERDLAGIDVVVGAKGSPLQLILAGVFHIDLPPGNIPWSEVQALRENPQVAQLIPLSLGDSFRGFRIVGTSGEYIAHYGAALASGAMWAAPMEAVVGTQVAREAGLRVGASFAGSHGLGAGGSTHDQAPYTVTGVLAPCRCVLDRLILTATDSVWQLHEKMNAADEADRRALQAEREVTMALIRYRSPLAAVTFPRYINASTPLQAASPAVEVTRLFRLLGVGTEVLRGFGVALLLAAGLSMFIAMWSAVRERLADLAMLRMLGAPAGRVAGLVACEALWLAWIGTAVGLAAGHALAEAVGQVLQAQRSLPITGAYLAAAEAWIALLALGVAAVAALLPALTAYRVDVLRLLARP
ncbi:MAG: ABC transporter permease [Betaproteobacteria bacterium]|nr:ABC transporter permease [Betaproteobacteria bacterium]